MTLYTSNISKQEEFKRLFGIYPVSIKSGEEHPEVLGNINEIILYKSLAFGNNSIVEDTTAIINGIQYPDMNEVCNGNIQNGKLVSEIKHKYKELKTGDTIKNISSLAINRDGKILIFRGTMYGVIDRTLGNGRLDAFMTPILGQDRLSGTMEDLTNRGFRDLISWRARAVRNFLRYESIKKGASLTPYLYKSCQPVVTFHTKNIPPWTGDYQKD